MKYFVIFWYYLIFFNLFLKFEVKYKPNFQNFQNENRKLLLKREKEIFQNYGNFIFSLPLFFFCKSEHKIANSLAP